MKWWMYGELNPSSPRIGWLLCVDAPTATHRACAIIQIYTHILVPGAGIEPARSFRKLQVLSLLCLPISPSGQIILVRRERLELSILSALASETSVYTIPPPTQQTNCTAEPRAAVALFLLFLWSEQRDSNSRYSCSQSKCHTRLGDAPNNFFRDKQLDLNQ